VNEKGYSSSAKTVSTLEINTNGSWEMVFKPIESSRNFDGNSISGNMNEVIEAYFLKNKKQILNVTHNGDSNFIIYGYDCGGKITGLVVNEIGNVSGTYLTDLNTCYLEINAEGSWSISK
jgi:hypothetical protein